MHEIIHYLDEAENDLYQNWIDSLRDRMAKVAIIRRVARMEVGVDPRYFMLLPLQTGAAAPCAVADDW